MGLPGFQPPALPAQAHLFHIHKYRTQELCVTISYHLPVVERVFYATLRALAFTAVTPRIKYARHLRPISC